jgi:O-antigen/teichoic acid export membrane protein
MTHKYIKNATILFAERVLLIGLSLLVNVTATRYLPQSDFGTLNYLLSLTGTLIPISKWGYDSILVREFVRQPALTPQIMRVGLQLRVVGAIFSVVLALVIHHFFGTESQNIWVLWLFGIFIGTAFTVPDSYFQAKTQVATASGIRVSVGVFMAILRLILLYQHISFDWYLLTFPLDPLLQAAIFWVIYLKNTANGSFQMTNYWHLTKSIFSSSWPMALMACVALLNARADFLIINQLSGATALAVYSTAAKLSEAWYFLPTAFATAYFPWLSKSKTDTHLLSPKQYHVVGQLSGGGFWTAVAIALAMQWFAQPIIVLLFDDRYLASISILQIHIWAGVFIFWGHPISKLLIVSHLERYLLYIKLIATAANISLNYWFIPRYGIIGSAWASLITYALGSCIGYAFFKPTRQFFVLQLQSVFSIGNIKKLKT